MRKRNYFKKIWADFNTEKKLILVSGPRQAGKTTFAKDIASKEPVAIRLSEEIGPILSQDQILMDLCSLKETILKSMLRFTQANEKRNA